MVAGKGSEMAPAERTSLRLHGDRDIVIARTFDAPARLVFDAWTKPELVRRWWAPRMIGDSIVSCEADVRAGGHYRYVLRSAMGDEYAFSGRYSEVTPHTRVVYTQLFEPTASGAAAGDAPLLVTVTFVEREGKTELVSRSLCPSTEVRNMILASGMEQGMRETMDQLEEVVASLR